MSLVVTRMCWSSLLNINDFDVKRILVEFGSSTNVLFLDALLVIGKSILDLKKVDSPD